MKDRICPKATECEHLYSCEHAKPHHRSPCCDPISFSECGSCIQIPELWLDKSEEGNQP